jgi:hypothetical protein
MKRKIIQTTLIIFIALTFQVMFSPAQSNANNAIPSGAKIAAAACDIPSGGGAITSSIFVPWYKYLGNDRSGECKLQLPEKTTDCSDGKSTCTDLTKTATLVSIAIIELLTRVSALVAVGFIIYGSFQYITSQGEPEGIRNAKSTIINAVIGFIIVVLSIAIIQFLGRTIQ